MRVHTPDMMWWKWYFTPVVSSHKTHIPVLYSGRDQTISSNGASYKISDHCSSKLSKSRDFSSSREAWETAQKGNIITKCDMLSWMGSQAYNEHQVKTTVILADHGF